ncbi:DegV family protein [Haloimpatiens sp. FM7315]|uniref:DegV family protein n=1 Tax=Haloimpatiens sp. FM7315 TaxID=3298609 RepID=UPI0035A33EC2
MSKIALITDSISDVSKEFADAHGVKILPLKIIYKDKEYLDRVDITPEEVYSRMPSEIPTTSLPSMEEINNLFLQLENEGYTHAIVIPVSSNLSGTYNALKLISEDHPNLNTYVYDSKSISLGEGCIVEECALLIEKGESFLNIINHLPNIRKKVHLYYVLDTLEYLKKGGRIGRVSGTIGEFLNIKPIISVDDEGRYYTAAKARGKKQAINKLLSIVQEILEKCKCKVFIMHGGAAKECEKFYETIKGFQNITSIYKGEISPTAGVHTGPGLLGIALLEE